VTARRLDGATLPRGVRRLLVLLALVFAALWAQHHGYLDLHGVRELARGNAFRLRHVDFIGLRALDRDALWSASGVAAGTPLVDLDPDAVVRVLAKQPRVAKVRAARLFPDRLAIAITERVPVAIEAANGLAVDANGARFPALAGEAESLPVLSGDLRVALPVLAAAREDGLHVASVEAARPGEVHVRMLGRATRLLVGADARASFADWHALSDSELVESEGAQEVDLRFKKNPVLRDLRRPAREDHGEAR
jgi:POTRA domain-containing FtsQ-type protein